MKIPFEQIESAIQNDDMVGFCLACGNEQGDVEPDAERYECESCGKRRAYGAEQILQMGMADTN